MASTNDANRFMHSVKGSVRNVIRRSFSEDSSKDELREASHVAVRKMQKIEGWLIHPHSRSALVWDMLVVCLLGIQAAILPLQIAFLSDDMLDEGYFVWIVWFNCWVDLVLWCDVFLQFFVQTPSPDGAYWVRSLGSIAWRYFRKELLIDVCGLLPLRYIAVQLLPKAPKSWLAVLPKIRDDSGDTARCGISLLCFHKMLRFSRISRLHRSLQGRSFLGSFSYRQSRIVKLFLTVAFTCHVMGCCWATLGVCGYGKHNWFHFLKATKGNLDGLYADDNFKTIYMCSLYWAMFTLTGVGYGDIVPVSPIEYLMSNLFMLMAALVWAWVIASVVALMATMNQASNEHLQTLDCINELLRDNNVKVHLGRRLREYFTKLRDTKEHDFIGGVINRLSPDLKLEVVHAAHSVWLEKVWWLNKVPAYSQFMADMCLQMKATLHAPNELLPNKQELSVVLSGLCMHGGFLVTKNGIYGEDMLLNSEALRKPFATLAMTFLHLLVLTRPLLNSLVLKYPEAAVGIRRCYVKFSLIRGILYTADVRKRRELEPTTSSSRKSSRNYGLAVVDRGHMMKPMGDTMEECEVPRVTSEDSAYVVGASGSLSRREDSYTEAPRSPLSRLQSFAVVDPASPARISRRGRTAAEMLVSGYNDVEATSSTAANRHGGVAHQVSSRDVADLKEGTRTLTRALQERASKLEASAQRLTEQVERLKRL